MKGRMRKYLLNLYSYARVWFDRKFVFKGNGSAQLRHYMVEMHQGLIDLGLTSQEAETAIAQTVVWANANAGSVKPQDVTAYLAQAAKRRLSERAVKA
jgi:hypothetical protein